MTWENLCKEFKLSYMQMQEWIRTMVLMAIARILSPKRDSPYLVFCCRRRMEFQTKTLFSAIPSWWRVSVWSLSPPISQILCEGFIVLRSCSYALWFPCRFLVVPRARQGYRLWVLMASPALSLISSGWMLWPGNIVRPSVGRRTSVCPLMLSWISPAPTSTCAFVVLKNDLPRMRGILTSTSMSRMTKSTGIKKFWILTGTFSAIPTG